MSRISCVRDDPAVALDGGRMGEEVAGPPYSASGKVTWTGPLDPW